MLYDLSQIELVRLTHPMNLKIVASSPYSNQFVGHTLSIMCSISLSSTSVIATFLSKILFTFIILLLNFDLLLFPSHF